MAKRKFVDESNIKFPRPGMAFDCSVPFVIDCSGGLAMSVRIKTNPSSGGGAQVSDTLDLLCIPFAEFAIGTLGVTASTTGDHLFQLIVGEDVFSIPITVNCPDGPLNVTYTLRP